MILTSAPKGVSEWVPGNDTKYSYDVEAQIGSGLSVKEEPKWALNADCCGDPVLAPSSPQLALAENLTR